MPILIKAGETVAVKKRVFFQCVDSVDGITPETGEVGGQPQISVDGEAWTNIGIGVLVAVGNGRYYAILTNTVVETVSIIESRYKSANTAEAVGTTVQVVGFDPAVSYAPSSTALVQGDLDGVVSTIQGTSEITLTDLNDVAAKLDSTVEVDGDVYRFTTNALENGPGGSGSGVNQVTITLVDQNDAPVPYHFISIKNTALTVDIVSPKQTDVNGALVINLQSGSYKAVVETTTDVTPGAATAFTVDGTEVVEITVTSVALPSPVSEDEVVIYSDEVDPQDSALVGAADRTAYVHSVVSGKYSPKWKKHFQALSNSGTGKSTNANGRWQMNLPVGIEVVIRIKDNTSDKEEFYQATMPLATGTYSFWDLSPELVVL